MIVAVWFEARNPSEVQGAGCYRGAATVEMVHAGEIIRRAADELAARGGSPIPRRQARDFNLGAAGVLSTGADDVVVTVQWDPARRLLPPELDYLHGGAPSAGQLYTGALALDEIVRFGMWRRMTEMEREQAGREQAAQEQLRRQQPAHGPRWVR